MCNYGGGARPPGRAAVGLVLILVNPELGKDIIWPADLMVLKVKKGGKPPRIEQFMGEVSDYTYGPAQNVYAPLADPKYPDPTAQLDRTNLIEPGPDTYCENGY